MENATKALLIAAAVLVAILIISLGLMIYNRASETVNTAGDLSEYEIQQFNSKFLKYEGSNVSASEANALLQTAFNHNLANYNSVSSDPRDRAGRLRRVRVGLNGGGDMASGTDISKDQKWLIMREQFDEKMQTPKVPAGKRYNIVVNKIDPQSKLVEEIQIYYTDWE